VGLEIGTARGRARPGTRGRRDAVSAARARERQTGDPRRASGRRSARPSTSGRYPTIVSRRPRDARHSQRRENSSRWRHRIDPSRSRSASPSEISETPPSGAGARTAWAPSSRASNAASRLVDAGSTSPPTRTTEPPSLAARRAVASRRSPRLRPACGIQRTPAASGRARAQPARSSGGAASTSSAPLRRAASSQPAPKPAKRSRPAPAKPFSRASRAGSRPNRTRKRSTVSILRQRGVGGFEPREGPKNGKGGGPRLRPSKSPDAAQRFRSMNLMNSLRGSAPRTRSATSPFLKRMKVGIEVT
jgi:hypothetical protein